jgi:hypothetical protein
VRYDYYDAVDTLESSSNIALVLGREKIVEPKQEVKMAILLFLQTCLTFKKSFNLRKNKRR